MLQKTKNGLEYTFPAHETIFESSKGVFKIVGTDETHDTFREVGTANFNRWKRSDVYDWLKSGKIKPYNERSLSGCINTPKNKNNSIQTLKIDLK
jgi:hypothetical protein